MSPAAIDMITRLLRRFESIDGRAVVDSDTHVADPEALDATRRQRYASTADYYHGRPISAEMLVREMEMAGVDMALTWQDPAATNYDDDPEHNTRALAAANRYVRDSALRFPDRLIPAGWVDPKACGIDNAMAMVDMLVREFGFFIVKLNPAQNQYPIDSLEVLAVVDRIVSLGAVPAMHFGGDTPYTPADGLRRLAERHAGHPLLGVHMGGGGAAYIAAEQTYQDARRLGLECPNIRYVLSAKRDAHIESDFICYQLAGEPFSRHLFCGSDAPYGRMTWNFGGFREMLRSLANSGCHTDCRVRENPGLFSPEVTRNYLGGNFVRFAAEGCRRLLAAAHLCPEPCR